MHPLFDQVGGGSHVHDLRRARIADRPGAAHEQQGPVVDGQIRVVDAVVIVLRTVEHHGAALKGLGILRI
jgi:hypothetical protein